jgi:peptidoglycan/xylan/chitin deacetylase (PgdA/CDA1 family)
LKDSDEIDAWTVVKESQFLKQVKYLKNHFCLISLDEALQWMELPTACDRPLAVLTFDDGYAGNRRVVLPIIDSMAIPITVFVSTSWIQNQQLYWYDRVILALQSVRAGSFEVDLRHVGIDRVRFASRDIGESRWNKIQRLLSALKDLSPKVREGVVEDISVQSGNDCLNSKAPVSPMSIDELKELAASKFVTIGAHSHCHNRLVQLSSEQIEESLGRSKQLLEKWTGKLIRHFAYPNGDYNLQTIALVKQAGFSSATTTVERLWSASDSAFEIPRIGIGRYDSFGQFKVRSLGR